MYESHSAKMEKRLSAAIAAVLQPCFEQIDGLKELWLHSTPLGQDKLLRELHPSIAHGSGPTRSGWIK